MSPRGVKFGLILLGLTAALRAQDPSDNKPLTPYETALADYNTGQYQAAFDALHGADASIGQDERTIVLESRILAELKRFDEGEKLLRSRLTPTGPVEIQLALGDLLLRKHSFARAEKYYSLALQAKPGEPDILLKLVYCRVGAADLVDAAKYASQLKPLDPTYPCYYFAKAAMQQGAGTGAGQDSSDIQTARTIYGITVTNRYLKTYLQVFAPAEKGSTATDITPPPLIQPAPTNAP